MFSSEKTEKGLKVVIYSSIIRIRRVKKLLRKMRDTQSVYDAPLIEETTSRGVGDLMTIPARTNYVVVETIEEKTRVNYQRISNGQVVEGFGSQEFGSDLQELIIDYLIKLNPGYCGDDLS